MFHFGSSEQNAQLYREYAESIGGPLLPDVHWAEMSEKHLRIAFTRQYTALSQALRAHADDETIEYDEVFQGLEQASDRFCEAVLSNRHQFLPGPDKATIKKYKDFARRL